MQKLNQPQREQARLDLAKIHAANITLQKNLLVPADLRQGIAAIVSILDTLAIGAGIFYEGFD